MKTPPNKSSSPVSSSGKKERFLERRRKQQRARTLKTIGVGGALVGLVLLFIFITLNNQPDTNIEGLQAYPNQERGHTTEPVAYPQSPPVGGAHHPAWQNCGVYAQPLANQNGVHSLEHGAVWITYQPDLPAAELAKLQALTRQSNFRLLSPYPDLSSPIVLSAWGYQLQVEQADDPRLAAFIENFEQSPQAPEPGAPCTGGLGEPG